MPARKVASIEKKRRGTNKPCREPAGPELEFEVLKEVPEPPDILDVHAQKYWNEITPVLVQKRVLSDMHLGPLTALCALQGKFIKATMAGMELNGSLFTQLRLYQEAFGLTPASQAKVIMGGEGKKTNRFSGRGKRTT